VALYALLIPFTMSTSLAVQLSWVFAMAECLQELFQIFSTLESDVNSLPSASPMLKAIRSLKIHVRLYDPTIEEKPGVCLRLCVGLTGSSVWPKNDFLGSQSIAWEGSEGR